MRNKRTALKASSDVEAYFLSKNSFLKYFQNYYVDNGYFEDVFINEYLRMLLVLEKQLKIKNKDLIENLNKFKLNKKLKAILFKPGKHKLNTNNKKMFISSNNIKNYKSGDFIDNGSYFEVSGNIPARLINISEIKIPRIDKKEIPEIIPHDNLNNNLINKQEALEDMFGSFTGKESFPNFIGKNESSTVLSF